MAAAAEQDAAAAANARQRADQLLAEAEVAAAERMLEAAELEFNSARRQQTLLQQELGQVRFDGCVWGNALVFGRKRVAFFTLCVRNDCQRSPAHITGSCLLCICRTASVLSPARQLELQQQVA